jgi:hypothetical protein
LDFEIELASGVLQGFRSGGVGAEFRVEVAEDSDANGSTHGSIVLEGKLRVGRHESKANRKGREETAAKAAKKGIVA